MKSKSKELTAVASDETLALLQESYPMEQNANRISLPRLGMFSQDKTEGKGKQMKVIAEAGVFFIEKATEEEDENGKKIWVKDEIGTSIEAIILFQRKQLRMYDETTETFTNSTVFDSDDEIVPLFANKSEVARGTPKELKEKYQYTDKEGKIKSRLEDNRILYIQYEGEVYQMNLRGSSMYAFLTYARKTFPPSVVTDFSSEAKEKGSISWNQMTFSPKRKLTQKEAEDIVAKVQDIKKAVGMEKAQFARATVEKSAVSKEFDNFTA